MRAGIDQAISRGLSYAPYADMLWYETSKPDVAEAKKFAEIFWERLGHKYEATLTEYFGHDACHGPMTFEGRPETEPSEILLRLGVRDADQKKVDEFARLVPSLILSGPPGVTVTGGRPAVSEVLGYWPCLVPRDAIE